MTIATANHLHLETRNRLIAAAGEVFGEVGYQAATVREICSRAEVNVASVNYHFRDKLGLYTEALTSAVGHAKSPALHHLPPGTTPEQALRLFLLGMFKQMYQADRPSWYTKVMAHELAQPTPGLAVVVEQIIRPKAQLLCGIVGNLIGRGPRDVQTRMCAHSIIGQVIHYVHARPVISILWPDWEMTPKALEQIADHVTEFSLAALKGIKAKDDRASARRKGSK